MSDPLFAIDGLTVRFGGLTAVDDFSMAVQPGVIHALIGPNGAGKSTVFNCISRFYQPAAGSIRFDGNDILARRSHEMAELGVARTFQNLELFKKLSVMENVLLGMHARRGQKRSKAEERDEAAAILNRVGLIKYRDQPAEGLDFGHQKLLELARALAIKPRLLLLDEPAAGLRNQSIRALDELLVDLVRAEGLTVILVEHVMALVMSISQRITVLSFGKKIAEGTPVEIRDHPQVIEAYLGHKRKHA
jgi:branched-chain amino acid transport system ATP-binding protein